MSEEPTIYLLSEGAHKGPFGRADIESMLERAEVGIDHLSAVEGMKAWRPLSETLVWAAGILMRPHRGMILDIARNLAKSGVHLRDEMPSILKEIRATNPSLAEVHREEVWRIFQLNISYQCELKQFEQRLITLQDWPVEELIVHNREVSKRDFISEWEQLGGKLVEGRMIARNDSEIWIKLSDYGLPVPPFSSDPYGEFLEGVERGEAVDLGLIGWEDEVSVPSAPPWDFVLSVDNPTT